MNPSSDPPDPSLVAALNRLADEAKRNARQVRRASSDLASSARAFFGPSFRAVVSVVLIVLLVVEEAQRRSGPTAA